ncbi:hypothetical protein F3157_04105 [Virgibacillus dakarensis]|nr:hypothetical protein [Virgibacillus dakarensis]
MGITSYAKFSLYKNAVFSLTLPLQKEEIVAKKFLLEQSPDAKLSIYYAPVEYINDNAAILIVGITPGFHQMQKAYTKAIQLKVEGLDNETILHQAKLASSYQGTMRKNLIQMLDELSLPDYLGLASAAELFGDANHLLHTTGLIPYPVFYKNKNYTGSTPDLLANNILSRYVMECFVNDAARLKKPVIIPLGVTVAKVLSHLAAKSLFDDTYLLTGFPHPSGANGHRHRQFALNKERMRKKLAVYFS